jgi:hypothetical protein
MLGMRRYESEWDYFAAQIEPLSSTMPYMTVIHRTQSVRVSGCLQKSYPQRMGAARSQWSPKVATGSLHPTPIMSPCVRCR